MNINGVNTPGLRSVTPETSPAAAGLKNKEADKDMFLTLLVAQLKHQDPLAPQDGTAFVAQLAQFNSLDQLININKQLGTLLQQQPKPSADPSTQLITG